MHGVGSVCAKAGGKVLRLFIRRQDGTIYVQQKVKTRTGRGRYFTLREAKDTLANYKDILRWADAVGHTLEEK